MTARVIAHSSDVARACIASGAVNGAVLFGAARNRTGVDVTNVERISSSAVLHGTRRDLTVRHWAGS